VPVRPIIEIQVDDAAFKQFYDLFNEYSTKLEDMPEAWRTLGEAMGSSSDALKGGALDAKEALAVAAAQAGVIAEALKDATKAQTALGRATGTSQKAMQGLANAAGGVGDAISLVGGWIIKLGALAGLGALFGGFGIGDLASSAFTRFRSAAQLGLTPGQLASWQVNMQQFLGTDALQSALQARLDITKAGALAALGIPWQHAQAMTTPQLAISELSAAVKLYARAVKTGTPAYQVPGIALYLNQLGGNLGDIINAYRNPAAFAAQQRAYYAGVGPLGFSQQTAQAWANLKVTLDKAGLTIQTALIDSLAPLAPKIQTLASDLAAFIRTVITSKNLDPVIAGVETGLEKLSHFLVTTDWAKAGKDIGTFESEIESLVSVLKPIVNFLNPIAKALNPITGPPAILKRVTGFDAWHWLQSGGPAAAWNRISAEGTSLWNVATLGAYGAMSVLKNAFGLAGSQLSSANIVASVAKSLGVNPILALATAMQESGLTATRRILDHYASGAPAGYSTGLFQLNQYGEGAGLTIAQLLDPTLNAKIALAAFARVAKMSPQAALNAFSRAVRASGVHATHADIMAVAGTPGMEAALAQRPAFPLAYAEAVDKIYAELTAKITHRRAVPPKTHRTAKPPVHVSVTNATSARVAVSVNAVATG
jgi:hypothetical protein